MVMLVAKSFLTYLYPLVMGGQVNYNYLSCIAIVF
jgi:hypothetical protein